MRNIQFLLLIGILVSLATANLASKDDTSEKSAEKAVASGSTANNSEKSTATESGTITSNNRRAKSLKAVQPGDNRGKRNLYDFGNSYLYSQVAARRAGYSPDPRTAYSTQQVFSNGNDQYTANYGPYQQYIEAPEPIIEIIIKDANETLPNPQPTVVKTKKKKEKVHVFYVNYKKDENNKLHLESPIASLNNDQTEEEEDEEDEVIEYPATPSPPVKTTTLRAIIHPDSEKYHADSGIHVTFGAQSKTNSGHEEHDAESVQRQVVAVPISSPQTTLKTQYPGTSRQDFQGHARSPFASSLFQGSSNLQYHQPAQQQQLPSQHVTNFFSTSVQRHQQQNQHTQYSQQQQQQQNYQQKSQSQIKLPYSSQLSSQSTNYHQQQQPQQQQQQLRKPLSQIQQHINQQLQQQSQYYVNHKQLYQTQQQPHQNSEPNQYYNNLPQKPTHVPKQPIAFPTAPPKSQELPLRQAPQAYQPIKFRPTPAPINTQNRPTPIAAKLENSHYNSKPYQFQKQPQFVQQPSFTVQSPTISSPQFYKQQQQHHHHQVFSHAQSSNYQATNSNYYTQNKNHPSQASIQQQPQVSKYQAQSPSAGSSSNLSWLNIKPSKETELFKSIPKFEQHITETIQNNYQPSSYQTQNQVIHDIPAPNLGPHNVNNNNYNGQYQSQSQPQSQGQSQFSNFVTTSSNSVNQHQLAATTPAPHFVESNNGQKIMVVTPMPPNVYQQYQSAHYPTSQDSQAQIVTSVHQSQDQYSNYFQQPRQSSGSVQAQTESTKDGSSSSVNSKFSVSTYHSDVFKELEQRKPQDGQASQNTYIPANEASKSAAEQTSTTTTPNPKLLQQLPAEVPDDLRQQLISSGILSNADISILDYDKEGDIALENLPAEHLQHFYGAGGGAQISESKKVLSVLKPNGDKVSLDAKEIQRVKEISSLPNNVQADAKIVRFDPSETETGGSTGSAERQYNRYLPLKINAANFPTPVSEELKTKTLLSVVVLAPVDSPVGADGSLVDDTKEVKFLGGDLIKTLVKKPTKENFKRWLEKESRTDVEQQSVVLLVAKPANTSSEQEIYMYDISTGEVNKLNGELSSKFVNVAEENASAEDLERGSTLDPNFLDAVMQKSTS
ncbi:uncharacterized protein LOC101901251 isoform X2 [Musca domestica]|uniref:Uncharacterized protein LOC101901251 isoform X2 n=1 Tax=Musca domestica TaxID=7370 RepID=A0A9J7DER9_MUSDO|nr:uncharacterized protein LOC101901251 isoform X2 [Musca domestica]